MPGVPVTVAKAVETSVPVEVHAIGNVEAWSSVQIKSQVAGILTHVDFTEGQEVHKGQLLFQIDPRPYQDTYNQAAAAVARDQAQLQQAQANQARDEAQSQNAEVLANRYAELLKDGVVSKEQHESYATTANMQREALRSDQAAIAQARAAIQADTANLNAAELNLEFCKITAPIEGRTGNLAVKEGNLVKAQADNALVTINQIEPVYVTFSVPETYLPDIRRFSAQGRLQVEAYAGEQTPIVGELSFIDNSVNAATGTIQIKGTFRNSDRKLWPGQDPIGRMADIGGDQVRVIGVVADVHESSAETAAGWQMYLPASQQGPEGANLVVRSQLPPETLAPAVMATLRQINPNQPATEFKPVQGLVDHAVSPRRFFVLLVGVFAGLGLLLAALGIYGVISYSVTQRTQEIGIRMALGATRTRVQLGIVGKTLVLGAIGIALGTAASITISSLIASLLFGTAPNDPATFTVIALLLTVVAVFAGYLPARRASRIDPMIALRNN